MYFIGEYKMVISSISNVNFRGQGTPVMPPKSEKTLAFIEDAKSKINKTGLITGSVGFLLTAFTLGKYTKLGLIGKLLLSAAVGTLTSAAGMFVRANSIFKSEEYKKLFFDDYKKGWGTPKKV